MADISQAQHESPLISNRTLLKMTAAIGILAAVTAAISVAGKYFGDELSLGGNTTSTVTRHIIIGQDVVSLPDNVIRFEAQRRTGPAESVNLYLTWPGLEGYTDGNSAVFSNPASSDGLVFIDLSQSVMTRDMSGRLEPIYRMLFSGVTEPGPGGLTLHRLKANSGFGDEVMLTGRKRDGSIYAVRCIMPSAATASTAADCQRDIHIGRDLTLLYRFSTKLLPQWQELDAGIVTFANAHLTPEMPQ